MKISYRPEIDGLRAVAVISVILYHAKITISGFALFSGGFIGVDIFFVISGYLISSIIFKELITTGNFSFKNFYERRIRRILPALLFVMFVSLILGTILLLPNNFVDFSKSLLYSLIFNSNFYFWYSGQEYGAPEGLLKPLLHTWTLSVEEQFYIFFPIIVLIIFKFFKKYLFDFLFLGFVLSLLLSTWGSTHHPELNFYILPTRGWELLAGSILAYHKIKSVNQKKISVINSIFNGLGFLFIGYSIFFFDNELLHPSYYTLLPIVGTSLIIYFSRDNQLTTKILSSKLFVGIGLISYSLYLWHYPIYAFVRNTGFVIDNFFHIFILVLIIILSFLTYLFIEKPARNFKYKFRNILFLLSLTITILICLSSFVIHKKGEFNYFNLYKSKDLKIDLAKQIKSPLFQDKCKYLSTNIEFEKDDFFKNEFDHCLKKFEKFILIVGDSQTEDLFNSIGKISSKDEFILSLSRGGCRPYDSSVNQEDCHYSNVLNFIKSNKSQIKNVLFSHLGSYFLTGNNEPLINKKKILTTIEYIEEIKEITNDITFIGPHIELELIEFNYEMIKNLNSILPFTDKTNYDILKIDKELKAISRKRNIEYISKFDVLNFNFRKDFKVGSNLTYSDGAHWNEFGELYFGKKLILNSKLKNIILLD